MMQALCHASSALLATFSPGQASGRPKAGTGRASEASWGPSQRRWAHCSWRHAPWRSQWAGWAQQGPPDEGAALAGQVLQRLPGCIWVEEVQDGACTQV